jgi:hypothetical protein
LIGVLFLDQGILDEPLGFRETQLLGPCEQGAVASESALHPGPRLR